MFHNKFLLFISYREELDLMNENHINSSSTATIGPRRRGAGKHRSKVPGSTYNHTFKLHQMSFPVSPYLFFSDDSGNEMGLSETVRCSNSCAVLTRVIQT